MGPIDDSGAAFVGPMQEAGVATSTGLTGTQLGVGAGITTAFGLLSTFLSSKMQSDINVANIDAQTVAYRQMAEYAVGNAAQMGLNQRNFKFERSALEGQSMQARQNLEKAGALARGRFRVAQADSGAAMSGSKADLLDQIDRNNVLSQKNLESNIANAFVTSDMQFEQSTFNIKQGNIAGINQYKNQINEYNNRIGSVPLAGFQGGLSGFSTGISIAGGLKGLAS